LLVNYNAYNIYSKPTKALW